MQFAEIQFTPWDQSYYFKPENETGLSLDLRTGDKVVAETAVAQDLGTVISVGEVSEQTTADELKSITRIATAEDITQWQNNNQRNHEILKTARALVRQLGLSMKLVEVNISLDDKRLAVVFIAEGRVDFRELVKQMGVRFKRNIRMHQIGVRDEAKLCGDCGGCGLTLCCQTCLKEIGNVSAEQVKTQQLSHRGADRLSGICGRLKCCLRYEQPVYEIISKKMPEIGSQLKTKYGLGRVISWQLFNGSVGVEIGRGEERKIVQVKVGMV